MSALQIDALTNRRLPVDTELDWDEYDGYIASLQSGMHGDDRYMAYLAGIAETIAMLNQLTMLRQIDI